MLQQQESGWEVVTDPNEIKEVLGTGAANNFVQSGSVLDPKKDPNAEVAAKEAEKKTATLATRLAGSVIEIAGATKRDPGAASPSPLPVIAKGILGEGPIGSWATNAVTDGDRQIVEGAQLNAMDAALTLGTGAAYTEEQKRNYFNSFFPQLGDKPENVAAKKKRLELLLYAARIGAGAAAPQIDQALAQAGMSAPVDDDIAARIAAIQQDPVFDETMKAKLIATIQQGAANGIPPSNPGPRSGFGGLDAEGNMIIDVVGEKPPEGPGIGERLLDSTLNKVGAVAKGAASLIDIPANAIGGALQYGAELTGQDWLAEQLRNRVTIGGTIDKIVPKSTGTMDSVAGFLGEMGGGIAAFPARAGNAVANALVGRVPVQTARVPDAFTGNIAKDMEALNMTPRPALTGGVGTRTAAAISEATPFGTVIQGRAAMQTNEEAARALTNIANREGGALSAEAAGEIATRGALAYRDTSRNTIRGLYDRAAKIAGDVKVKPDATVMAIDQNLAELKQTPMAGEPVKQLTELREELVKKFRNGVTIDGIRGLRTQLRDKFYKDGLRGSDTERRINDIVQNISDDIARTLEGTGKSEAAALYRQADKAWAERVKTLDDFIMPIIGRKAEKSGEQVIRAIEQAAKGNGVRVKRFLNALPEEEAATTRASLIEGLGKASAGAADEFSLAAFATRWKDMSESAKNAFFTTNARSSIDRLARVAEQAKRAGRYQNWSRSGAVGIGYLTITSDVAFTAGAGQIAAGLLLTNPSVARVLGRIAAAKSPGEVSANIGQLSQAAKTNPALANEIGQLQQSLMRALNDNLPKAGQAAASPDPRPEQQQ